MFVSNDVPRVDRCLVYCTEFIVPAEDRR